MDLPTFILLGVLPVTSYMADPKQTDSTPTRTSINHRVNPFGAAVSPDLLASGEACYGDTLFIEGFGPRIINDVMNKRHKRRVDLFVDTKIEERSIQTLRLKVYVQRSPVRACNREEAMKMAMVNAKKIRKGIEAFKKQHGREPSYEEVRNHIISGAPAKRGTVTRTPDDLKGQAPAKHSR